MNGFAGRWLVVAGVCGTLWWAAVPASGELADVYLKSGLRLRGDVVATETDVIIRNAAGEVRLARAEVERIVPVSPLESQAATGPFAASDGEALRRHATSVATSGRAELPPMPPLSDEDIQRLKLRELRLDGPAEPVRVRFNRKGRQRDLPAEILEQLRRRADYRLEWEDVLGRGQPQEKLQLIVRLTGIEHADRIVIESDPGVFEDFRRRVLPMVSKGCARSGCHGGTNARLFRFPLGSVSSETYAYTSFVLLDELRTRHGPLLDRTNPEDSVLLDYLMPQERNPRAHPPVGRGPSFKAVIRDRDDRLYSTVLDWINELAVPHPDYGLEYRNPYAGRLMSEAEDKAAGEPVQEQLPTETQPAGDQAEPPPDQSGQPAS